MITQKRTFLYQPEPLYTVINWTWTFALLFIAIIFWLEVTVIQWITIFFFLVFCLFTLFQIIFRKITVVDDRIIISKVLNPKWLDIKLSDIDSINFTKHRATIVVNNRKFDLLLPSNSVIELSNLINK
ncbi:MAG: EbsA family protein [Apilactobacillus sp.]|uniref:EbsA family protein n=1 Tax=Apilactobacillus TaxID=2767877 RepID=UPI0025F37CA8|nr:EbsA family protein [Apilactobacillus sp.]MCT6822312.1 EbsA family protein [Apilactobacillus sp.]